MTFTPLASSSHGNAYLVNDGQTVLMLECGLPERKLRQLCSGPLANLGGVLVSHEHSDHSKSAGKLIAKGLKVYLSAGTADALGITENYIEMADREQFSIGTMDVVPFAVFHDAQEPLGFLIRSRVDSDLLAFATDTVNLGYRFPGVNILALEANYDRDILDKSERMPDKVKRRITNCHMEIGTLCRYLQTLDLSQCRELWLLHLSDATSHEAQFIYRAARHVPAGCKVYAAGRGG